MTDHEPQIQVLKGRPTDEELTALIAALSTISAGAAVAGPTQRNHWGLAVDKLRIAIHTEQRTTLQQRARMRR